MAFYVTATVNRKLLRHSLATFIIPAKLWRMCDSSLRDENRTWSATWWKP